MDLAISATTFADRCIKSSTQPCNPQTNIGSGMGYIEELSDFQRGTVTGCHLSNKSVHQISALLELPQSTVSVVIMKWKRLGATTAQPRSGRGHTSSHNGTTRVLKCLAWKNRLLQHSLPSSKLTGSNVSTSSVRREFHEMGFQV